MKAEDYIGRQIHEVEGLHIASWSPGQVSEGDPLTQVHVLIKVKDYPFPLVMRLKSRTVALELINALRKHTDEVWPSKYTRSE